MIAGGTYLRHSSDITHPRRCKGSIPKGVNQMKVSQRMYLWRMFSLTLFCALGFSAAAVGSFAQRGSQDLVIVNKTGVVIAALYATPHNSADWGEDILGADLLANNDEIGIVFTRRKRHSSGTSGSRTAKARSLNGKTSISGRSQASPSTTKTVKRPPSS